MYKVELIYSFTKHLLDEIFPPICLCCQEKGASQWFCDSCWQLLSLPNSEERCRHCFESCEYFLCSTCRKSPVLLFPKTRVFDPSLPSSILQVHMDEILEALASIAFLFCNHLGWDNFDAVMEVPDERGSKSTLHMAKLLAHLLGVPYVKGLKRVHTGFLKADLAALTTEGARGKNILLFDAASTTFWLKKATDCLSELLPKRAKVITIFGR